MRTLIIGLVLAVTLLVGAPIILAADQKKLNVLLIVSDDLCNNLSTYGAPAKTPNLDRLAQRGVKFDRAYCQFPLCGPSRASFMSGQRPDSIGVLRNGPTVRHVQKDVVTMSQLFRQNGYTAARVGKIYHLGIPGGVGTPGPDDPESWDTTVNPKGAEFSKDGDEYDPDPTNGQSFRRVILSGDGSDQHDHQAADEAIRLLNQFKQDGKPFFLALGNVRPHVPEVAPKQYFDLYPLDQIRLPDVPTNDRDDIPPLAFFKKVPNFNMDRRGQIESARAYHATTSFMDAQAGRVLDELDKLRLTDSTVVVFISDHGYLLGQHQEWQKMLLFEESCRVPMIVAGPGVQRNATARGLAELIDVFPTVAEMCGLTPPKEVQGQSLLPLLKDPSRPGKSAAFTQVTRNGIQAGRSIRTDRWRYTEWKDGEAGVELYDHDNDPRELTNLAKDPQYADVISDLRRQLRAVAATPGAPAN